jgi:hypothetical protein
MKVERERKPTFVIFLVSLVENSSITQGGALTDYCFNIFCMEIQ